MNDTILIILLVLMAATFVKVVVGAMRSKNNRKGKTGKLSLLFNRLPNPFPKNTS
jgi:hypothetical protein